jgi:hypothetical protein
MSIKCAETHCNKTVHAENTFCLNHALGIDEARRVVQAMTLGCDHVYEPAPIAARLEILGRLLKVIAKVTESETES